MCTGEDVNASRTDSFYRLHIIFAKKINKVSDVLNVHAKLTCYVMAGLRQESGQCHCKPNTCSGTCSTCKDGYYNLQEHNYLGCQGESSPWTEAAVSLAAVRLAISCLLVLIQVASVTSGVRLVRRVERGMDDAAVDPMWRVQSAICELMGDLLFACSSC